MSVYYDYYLAYMKKGKLYPLGPFDRQQKLVSVIGKSQSFASNLKEDFYDCPEKLLGPELKEKFTTTDWNGKPVVRAKYLKFDELTNESIVKRGYFLIDDVRKYEQSDYEYYIDDLFYEYLSPTAYAAKAINEAKFGKPEVRYDCEGNAFPNYSAGDYMYYAYIDYNSKEYESAMIRNAVNMLIEYDKEIQEKDVYILLKIN